MGNLRESVTIIIPGGTLFGYLFVGVDELPELNVYHPSSMVGDYVVPPSTERFRPATFPAAWGYRQVDAKAEAGPLLTAWIMIEAARSMVAEAQQEAEDYKGEK